MHYALCVGPLHQGRRLLQYPGYDPDTSVDPAAATQGSLPYYGADTGGVYWDDDDFLYGDDDGTSGSSPYPLQPLPQQVPTALLRPVLRLSSIPHLHLLSTALLQQLQAHHLQALCLLNPLLYSHLALSLVHHSRAHLRLLSAALQHSSQARQHQLPALHLLRRRLARHLGHHLLPHLQALPASRLNRIALRPQHLPQCSRRLPLLLITTISSRWSHCRLSARLQRRISRLLRVHLLQLPALASSRPHPCHSLLILHRLLSPSHLQPALWRAVSLPMQAPMAPASATRCFSTRPSRSSTSTTALILTSPQQSDMLP